MKFLDLAGVQQFKDYNDSKYVVTEDVVDLTAGSLDFYTKGEIDEILENFDPELTESDPVFTASAASGITSTDISNWNSKQDAISDLATIRSNAADGAAKVSNVQADWNATSGLAQILHKPTIPAEVTESTVSGWGFTKNAGTITGITMNGASKGTSGVIDLGTVITSHQDISGKADKSAAIGSLSLSLDSTNYKITLSGTKVDGTTFTVSNVIDLPLESVVVNGSYNNTTKKVVLTLQNGNTVDFSVADLVSGLQSEITSTNKLSADLISDGTTNKTVTATEKSTWNGKQDAISDLATIRSNAEAGAAKVSNVQSDWNANSGLAQILNKPTIPTTLDQISDGSTRKLSDYVTLGTAQTITGEKSFAETKWSLSANENNITTNKYWDNGTYYKTDDSDVVSNNTSIRNAIRFKWYADYFDIGILRGGASAAKGFAIGKENSAHTHVLDYFRVEDTGAYVLGDKIATESQLSNGSVTKVGTGTVGATDLPIYLNSGTPTAVTKLDASKISGYISANSNSYLVTHPEATASVLVPFIYNDIAFLVKQGGNVTIYSTTDTDLTADTLTVKTDWTSLSTKDNMFDGSASYWSPGNSYATEMNADGLIIDLVLPRLFTYSNKFYIDFGNASWGYKKIDILVKNSDNETAYVAKVTGGDVNLLGAHYFCSLSHSSVNQSSTTVSGFNRVRIHLYNRTATGGVRIAQIGLINYSSQGQRWTSMSRGIDDSVFRNISPNTSGTYTLGTPTHAWQVVYANQFVKPGGTNQQFIMANGTTQTLKTINNQSLLGSGNIDIQSGGGDTNVIETVKVNGTALTPDANKAVDIPITVEAAMPNNNTDVALRTTLSGSGGFNFIVGADSYFYAIGPNNADGEEDAILATTDQIPTESTVSGWGFTKNTGTYSKPSGGIPKTDLASAVQTSLGKADTALQSYTETDPVYSASAAAGITSTDITNWNNKVSNVQSDWNATSGAAVILNKPTIPAAPGTLKTNNTTAQSTSASEALSGTINLHQVSKTGNYYDLATKPRIFTGTCTIAAGTQAKTVTCASYDALTKGDIVFVTFSYTNTHATPTLNVNGKGAKSIKAIVNGALVNLPNPGALYANETIEFQYDGTYWVAMNTDTTPANELPSYSSSNNGQILSVVNGALAWITPSQIYSGSGTPSNGTGNNGDVYLQTS